MSNIFTNDHYIDVSEEEPKLINVRKAHRNVMTVFNASISAAYLAYFVAALILLPPGSSTDRIMTVVVSYIIINIVSTFLFNHVKRNLLKNIDSENCFERQKIEYDYKNYKSYYVDVNIKKPNNLTVNEWNNFIATFLANKNPNENGKVWLNSKDNKTITKFMYKNYKIDCKNEKIEKAQLKEELKLIEERENAKKLVKYKSAATNFVEKNFTNNIQ